MSRMNPPHLMGWEGASDGRDTLGSHTAPGTPPLFRRDEPRRPGIDHARAVHTPRRGVPAQAPLVNMAPATYADAPIFSEEAAPA